MTEELETALRNNEKLTEDQEKELQHYIIEKEYQSDNYMVDYILDLESRIVELEDENDVKASEVTEVIEEKILNELVKIKNLLNLMRVKKSTL
ncbi:hypothetical protein D3C85_1654800 [compost metagenome]